MMIISAVTAAAADDDDDDDDDSDCSNNYFHVQCVLCTVYIGSSSCTMFIQYCRH